MMNINSIQVKKNMKFLDDHYSNYLKKGDTQLLIRFTLV